MSDTGDTGPTGDTASTRNRLDRRRIAAVTGGAVLLAATFAAGSVWGGREEVPPGVVAAPPGKLQPANGALTRPASCEELLRWYVEKSLDLVGPYGWYSDSPIVYDAAERGFSGMLGEGDSATGFTPVENSAQRAPAPGALTKSPPGMSRSTSSATGTNVQEASVDEPDGVKTDGSMLVRLHDEELVVWDVTGTAPERLGSLDLPEDLAEPEMLLVGDRAVVVGQDSSNDPDVATTTVLGIDLADPEAPEVVDQRVYDARLLAARQHGDVVRIVLQRGLPDLDFVDPDGWRTEDGATRRNREIVRESTIADWLPSVQAGQNRQQAGACEDVHLPSSYAGPGTILTVGFTATEPAETSVTGLAVPGDIVYSSADRLYFATGGPQGWCCPGPVWDGGGPIGREPMPVVPREQDGVTDVHAFRLDGRDTSYTASGEVDGVVADRWAMDSAGGVLRVAVGPSGATGNFNSVVTLEEDGDDLVELGRLDKLGVNEQIMSMRWFDTLAIMVTFRQVDPLYAIDLSDPAHPKTLGKLKIPGFSDYLHPLGPNRILAMGHLGNGAQAALFDLSDFSRPRQTSVVRYGPGSQALAGQDPRMFTWLPGKRIGLTVISKGFDGRTGFVSALTVDGGDLANRMIEAEYGYEVDDLRLVPLPSGKVVLATGDGVEFVQGLTPAKR